MFNKREQKTKDIEYKLELVVLSSLFDGEEGSLGSQAYFKRDWKVVKDELETQAHLMNCSAEEGWRVKQMTLLNADKSDEITFLILYQREREPKHL
ncbi:MAG: hypothetical protein MRK02_11620 [Candidatus Scalindua sp.]|nr:hypothetical protein [Candidatus Scalindua sp.]